jgi:hypothetical protein
MDKKFDIQLQQGLSAENDLAEIMGGKKIELKTETWQWEQTGNICIEYEHNGKPSGIAATEADYWVHELRRDGKTLVYIMFPVDILKEICRKRFKRHHRTKGGDGGKSKVILLPLDKIIFDVQAIENNNK